MMDRVYLHDVVVRCAIGVTPEERRGRQHLRIDIDCFYDCSEAARNDDPHKMIDYSKVRKALYAVVEDREFKLVEALAETIATVLLEQFPIERVRVNVCKPHALLGHEVGKVGIEIERQR